MKVRVAVPTRSHNYSEVSLSLTRLLLNLQKSEKYDVDVQISYKQPVDANRNKIVKKFLSSECEWLLMMDADIVPPENILDMIEHGKKIVSATVLGMKDGVPHPLIMKMDDDKEMYRMVGLDQYQDELRDDGLIEIDGSGTGCILIHREVLEKMEPPWFKFEYNKFGDIKYSEDYKFSQKAKEMGYKIYCDTNMPCKHFKKVDLLDLNQTFYRMVSEGEVDGVYGKEQ